MQETFVDARRAFMPSCSCYGTDHAAMHHHPIDTPASFKGNSKSSLISAASQAQGRAGEQAWTLHYEGLALDIIHSSTELIWYVTMDKGWGEH